MNRPGGRQSRVGAVVVIAAALLVPAAAPLSPARAVIAGRVLTPASARVVDLGLHPSHSPIRLRRGIDDWHGRLSHLAGTAHYDRGEWIYEDYPETAYGAALPGLTETFTALGLLAGVVPSTQRLPGALAFVQAPAGAGPLVDQADLSQLRFAVRGTRLYVLARTTAMSSSPRTALLLLFDTGGPGTRRAVPFGSGLHTARADTAVLVTARGARIVDLRTGEKTKAPAVADPSGYVNSLEARLPLRRTSSHGSIRMVAAAGVAEAGRFQLVSNALAGPLAKVVPRLHEPVQAVYDRAQAVSLASHDIDGFLASISLQRLRAGSTQRLLPGGGYNVRTVDTDPRYSREGGTNGALRQYGLYLPRTFSWRRPVAATVMLRGSSMTAHSFGAISPNLFRQLGDDNGAVVISPGGRSGFDLFEGATYRDVNADIRDAERLLPIDPDRLAVAGYSMGGYGTYMFAATQPDRFAAAFVVEGPVGGAQPSTASAGLPDVIPALVNLRAIPIEIYQGDVDANVPITNALAAVKRLRGLGYRYRLDVFPGHTHFTHGIVDDYAIGAQLLAGARRDAHPAEVHFTRNMAYEHAVDTGAHSDLVTAGRSAGLRFDHAWFVHRLRARDARHGVASITVRSFARPLRPPRPVETIGTDPATRDGELPATYLEQHWTLGESTGALRNAFRAELIGASHVTLDLADMGLRQRRIVGIVRTDGRTTVTVRDGRARCSLTFPSRGTYRMALAPTLERCPG
jgi:pimeloyl-ACP methyl ester carboxylesterase